jgi:hypothetical protein
VSRWYGTTERSIPLSEHTSRRDNRRITRTDWADEILQMRKERPYSQSFTRQEQLVQEAEAEGRRRQ